jgi:5-hydroxyisourate hydrolase-like protein (transthyretin family)/predicted esterase
MKNFTKFVLVMMCYAFAFQTEANAQTVLDPNDPIVNYDSLNPPVQPAWGQIGKWVRRPSLTWNTESYKAYIYKGLQFRLKFPKSYNPTANDGKKYPILMFWHGLLESGDIHDNEYSMWLGGDLFRHNVDNGTFDGFVIFMQAPIDGGSFFASGHFNYMMEIIDHMVANTKLDPFRIISNGLSSGGMSSISVFLEHPTYVSSIIAMSAPGNYSGADIVNKVKFTPFWYAHGGEDHNPSASTGDDNYNAMNAAGANFKRIKYPGAYHDTWGATWWDPEFWPYVNRAYSANPWPLHGKTLFEQGETVNVIIGLAPGYSAYEWRRNGVIIPGATGNTIQATQLGIYDARIKRGNIWSEWSKVPVELKTGSNTPPPPPPPGSATRIEAESFTTMYGIQSEPTSDVGGGLNIGWQDNGDWLNYSVNVSTAGTYTLSFRVASPFTGAQFQLRKEDGTALTTVTVPNTGGFQNWQTVTALATLPAGQQTLRIITTQANGGWNFNWWEIPGTHNGGTQNQSPVVSAGSNQTISLPANSATLTGSASDPDGTVVSYVWSKISGPAGGNIATATQAQTQVNDLEQGTYVFRLTVMDNSGATASADVTVTVNATATNQPPTANAGANQTITLPTNSATLTGSGSDPDGTIASYAWTKISGPAGGTITSPTQASTTVTNLTEGTYTFRLTVTDNGGATATSDVTITVNAATTPPVSGIKIEAEDYINMSGIGTEGTSDIGGGLNVGWQDTGDWMDYAVNLSAAGTYTVRFRVASYFTGAQFQLRNAAGVVLATMTVPNTGSFQTWTTISTTVNLPAGQQTLRIHTSNANGGWNINWWEIVGASGGGTTNQPPTANAGANQTITLPTNSVTLTGSGSDADGTIVSYAWTKISGPSGGTITSPTQASTTVTNLTEGTYTFRLTVTDNGGATATSDVTITVNAATTSPVTGIKIEAEDYINMSGIGTEGTSDIGGGLNVGWQDTGDWMDYAVNLSASGTYTVKFRVASFFTGAQFQLRNAAGVVLATMTVPNTGSFQTWTTISTTVNLPSGQQTLRIHTSNANGGWNINWWEIVGASGGGTTNQPPTANAGANQTITLPTNSVTLTGSGSDADGTIVSYAWTKVSGPAGGMITTPSQASTTVTNLAEGSYVFRLTVTDNSGATATSDVTITVNAATTPPPPPTFSLKIEAEDYSTMSGVLTETTQDVGGGLNVRSLDTGDWMNYQVNIPAAGTYTLNFRVASHNNGSQLQVRNVAGNNLATLNFSKTGSLQTWKTLSVTASLPAGVQTLRIYISKSNGGWNMNWWEIISASAGGASLRTTISEQEPAAIDGELGVYPNPAIDVVQLKVNTINTGKLRVQVLNASGNMVNELMLDKNSSAQLLTEVPVGRLRPGVYVIRVNMNGWTQTIRFLKQ